MTLFDIVETIDEYLQLGPSRVVASGGRQASGRNPVRHSRPIAEEDELFFQRREQVRISLNSASSIRL